MSKRYHLCMNVRGFLSNTKFPQGFVGMFKHDDGRPMSPEDAREQLFDEIAKGHKVIPMVGQEGDECPGFDFGGGGCPGHEESPA